MQSGFGAMESQGGASKAGRQHERLVTLVARALKAGVVVNGRYEKTTKGCPQGSPLSPMLSNIVLNEMDQELERRGLTYCRWADDSVILVKSEQAAQRVMDGMIKYLEEVLKLPVNREKSEVAKFKDITYLSVRIVGKKIHISKKAIEKFERRVRKLTRRNNPLSMYQIIKKLKCLSERLDKLLSHTTNAHDSTRARRVDQKQTSNDATEEMEEAKEVPADYDKSRL